MLRLRAAIAPRQVGRGVWRGNLDDFFQVAGRAVCEYRLRQ